MSTNKKNLAIYPYPIISNNQYIGSYSNSYFKIVYLPEENEEKIILKDIRIDTNNSKIKKLLLAGSLKSKIIIDSNESMYKLVEEVTFEPKTVEILKSNLKGEVVVSSSLITNNDITQFTDNDLKELYKGIKFTIEKNSVVGIDAGKSFKISHDDKNDKKISSLFTISRNIDSDDKEMKVNINYGKKLQILLPNDEYEYYDKMQNKKELSNVFFTIVVLPTLQDALSKMQLEIVNDKTLYQLAERYPWFDTILRIYKNNTGKDLTDETFKDISILKMSQNLINNCICNGIVEQYNYIIKRGNEDEQGY
jgi:hypothetical protein